MKWFWCALAAVIIFFSCDKTASPYYDLSGLYVGYFHRSGMDTSLVSLRFSADRFEGTSNSQNYPAICGGTFRVQDNTIRFADTCMWTANFDWSLILSGTYNVEITDGVMRLWRNTAAGMDEYMLRRPVR